MMVRVTVCLYHVTCLQRAVATVCLCFLLVTSPWRCLASTEEYVMPGDTCHSYLLDKDAIVLKGMGKKTSPSEVCDVTVAAANNARWMFHIQTAVIMDCRVKILVYDKRIVVSAIPTPPVLVVGCASRDPGVIRFNSSVVTVRLYHKNESDYSFNLLITARDISPRCQGFKCSSGDCIPKSLMCDGVDNCFDFSDEAKNGTAYCDYNWPFQGENWGVLVSVLGVGLVLGVTAACCRQLRKRRDSFDELYDMNEGPYVHKYAYQYRVIRHPAMSSHSIHSSQSHHNHTHSHQPSRHEGDRDRGKVG